MLRCMAVWVQNPRAQKGHWRDLFPDAKELRLEIGCGKGKFTVQTAVQEPDVLFVALDKNADALLMAMEAAINAGVNNVVFSEADAASLLECFDVNEVDLVYLNFCDPWPSNRHRHRRLTHRNFLTKYRTILAPGGKLLFRTDSVALFQFSRIELREDGWLQEQITTDRHGNGPVGIMTDYEKRFYAEGKPICSLEAIAPDK